MDKATTLAKLTLAVTAGVLAAKLAGEIIAGITAAVGPQKK